MPLFSLPADEVHVWYAHPDRLCPPEKRELFLQLLSAEERAKQQRFIRPVDQQLYLTAHALLRLALSRYCQIDPEAWQFEPNEYGRPQIVAPESARRLQFNLSHTHGLAACAVAWERPLGVDVENLGRAAPGLDLAARYFSAHELDELRTRPEAAQPERFLEYWTLKEAYLKARGVGLSLGLDRFSMKIGPLETIEIAFAPGFEDDSCRWQFAQFRASAEHLGAVAVGRSGGETCRIICREFTEPGQPAAR